jgi:hypothetical protein
MPLATVDSAIQRPTDEETAREEVRLRRRTTGKNRIAGKIKSRGGWRLAHSTEVKCTVPVDAKEHRREPPGKILRKRSIPDDFPIGIQNDNSGLIVANTIDSAFAVYGYVPA